MEAIRNFRPAAVGHLFGQEHVIPLLTEWSAQPSKIPQNVMFFGPYGTGKTTVARIFAGLLATNSHDINEINAAESRGIDDVREWVESTRVSSFGPAKVYIIDELHQMTQIAQSALLKVIEEPPKGVYFFLCTTEPGKLLPTIRSRCTKIETKLLTIEATRDLLTFLGKGKLSSELMDAIFFRSGGHARDAVKEAEVVLSTGIATVEQLNAVQGTDYNTARLILQELIRGVNKPTLPDLVKVAQMSDERALTQMIDQLVDAAAISGNPVAIKNYRELLLVRAYRKEFKVTAQEQALHLISTLTSTH